MQDIFAYIDTNRDKFVENLQKLCRQKSISTQNIGIRETAELVRSSLRELRADVKYLGVDEGFPAVYGRIKGKGSKTILFYNHYDVQPPEPLQEWDHEPFSASLVDGKMYTRGASDNKGNLVARLSAVEAFLKVAGNLPVNIVFLVEGEEEIGSPNLDKIVQENMSLLNADCCIWESGGKNFEERPGIYLGVKGILYVELEVKEMTRDVHSSRATTIPNPAWKLVWALNSLKDKQERILIEGFYENVVPLTEEEKKVIKSIPLEDKKIKESLGIKSFLLGLEGKERIIRNLSEPTCTICGLRAGYTGPGSKTVLPHQAIAKIDFRLVPEQDPDEILEKLENHFKKKGFSEIRIHKLGVAKPFKTPLDAEISRIAIESAREIYNVEPVIYPTSQGTGPMYDLCGRLNIPCVSTGVDYAESNPHAPNENIRIADFIQGIKHIALIMKKFGET